MKNNETEPVVETKPITVADVKVEQSADKKAETSVLESSAEDMQLHKKRFLSAFGFGPDVEEPETKPAEGETKPVVAETEPAEPETKPAESETKPEPKKLQAILPTPQDVVVLPPFEIEPDAIAPAPKPKPVESKPDAVAALPEQYRRDMEVIGFMERQNPQHRGLGAKMMEHYGREEQYIQKWEQDHPGEKFDADADHHAEFYRSSIPPIDPDAIDDARVDMRVERSVEERERKRDQKTNHELEEMRVQQEIQRAMPNIAAHSAAAFCAMVDQADPELGKLMTQDGQKILTPASMEAMEKADPVAAEAIMVEGEKLGILVKELDLLNSLNGRYRINDRLTTRLKSNNERFRPHAELVEFVDELEQSIAALPADERVRDGRQFVPRDAYWGRVAEIRESKAQEAKKNMALREIEQKFYTLDHAAISRALVANSAEKVKNEVGRIARAVDHHTKTSTTKTSNGTLEDSTTAKTAPAKPASNKPSAKPPSSSSASDKTNMQPGGDAVGSVTKDDVMKSMFS